MITTTLRLCLLLLLTTASLAAQKTCHGSFELFGAGGVSNHAPYTSGEEPGQLLGVLRAGFGASYKVGDRLLLRTTFQFSQYGNRNATPSPLRWGSQHDGRGGFDPSLPSGEAFRGTPDRHHFISGIIALRYEFLRRRSPWVPFVEAGAGLARYGTTTHPGTDATGNERYRHFINTTPVVRLAAGYNYRLNQHFAFYGSPVLHYITSDLNEEGGRAVRPWQGTLEVGVRIYVDPR